MAKVPTNSVRAPRIELAIVEVREQKVMLAGDLARLYGVEVKALNQAVKRNRNRFPSDFMFQLTPVEAENLRSQSVTSSSGHGGRRVPPFAFTEQGVAMLSSVLRSEQAVLVNVEIMRAFVRLRAMLRDDADLVAKLTALEKRYDARFRVVFEAIRGLMQPSGRRSKPIGFSSDEQ